MCISNLVLKIDSIQIMHLFVLAIIMKHLNQETERVFRFNRQLKTLQSNLIQLLLINKEHTIKKILKMLEKIIITVVIRKKISEAQVKVLI